jgi:hypothetical protein
MVRQHGNTLRRRGRGRDLRLVSGRIERGLTPACIRVSHAHGTTGTLLNAILAAF